MADLSYIEKAKIESLFGMNSGYVLDFLDRTFQEFIGESVNIDIFSEKYNYHSGSKANRLRAFLKIESNYLAGKLLEKLIEYWFAKTQIGDFDYRRDESSYKECLKIVERLKKDNIVEQLDAIQPNSDDKDFHALAKAIKESIEKNEPENALDRLHTFTIKYIKQLCEKHKIEFSKEEPLHNLFGKYVKYLNKNKLIESDMSERILKSSISILDSFNEIRNSKSFAHDNPLLNYNESVLIFNNISSAIKFIENIEKQRKHIFDPEDIEWPDTIF